MSNITSSREIIAIIFAVLWSILSVCCIYGTFIFAQQLKNHTKTDPALRTLTIISCVLSVITMLLLTFWVMEFELSGFNVTWIRLYWAIIWRFFYFLSILSVTMVAALKLYFTLQGTGFEYPKYFYIIFWTFAIFAVIFGLFGTLGSLFLEFDVTVVCAIIAIIFFVLLTNYIIYLFALRIKAVGNSVMGHSQAHIRSKKQLFRVLTKFAILVVFGSLTTLFGAIMLVIGFAAKWVDDATPGYVFVYHSCILIDLMAHIASLYLQFEPNDKHYMKFCNYWHEKVVGYCERKSQAGDEPNLAQQLGDVSRSTTAPN